VSPLADHFLTFAHYNIWANRRLYDACAALPEADYFARRASGFFETIHGALNHIMVGDRAWMHRITGDGHVPNALDEELHAALADLRVARETEDARILDYVEACDDGELARVVRFKPMTASPDARSTAEMLGHLFNHQTHHRGQVHALLSDAGADPPLLDLIYYLREARPI
jgi:uncharacterized damage-inducible protein DinB